MPGHDVGVPVPAQRQAEPHGSEPEAFQFAHDEALFRRRRIVEQQAPGVAVLDVGHVHVLHCREWIVGVYVQLVVPDLHRGLDGLAGLVKPPHRLHDLFFLEELAPLPADGFPVGWQFLAEPFPIEPLASLASASPVLPKNIPAESVDGILAQNLLGIGYDEIEVGRTEAGDAAVVEFGMLLEIARVPAQRDVSKGGNVALTKLLDGKPEKIAIYARPIRGADFRGIDAITLVRHGQDQRRVGVQLDVKLRILRRVRFAKVRVQRSEHGLVGRTEVPITDAGAFRDVGTHCFRRKQRFAAAFGGRFRRRRPGCGENGQQHHYDSWKALINCHE